MEKHSARGVGQRRGRRLREGCEQEEGVTLRENYGRLWTLFSWESSSSSINSVSLCPSARLSSFPSRPSSVSWSFLSSRITESLMGSVFHAQLSSSHLRTHTFSPDTHARNSEKVAFQVLWLGARKRAQPITLALRAPVSTRKFMRSVKDYVVGVYRSRDGKF